MTSDDSPIADDDHLNEERLVAHVIMHWMVCQKTSVVTMTHRQRFNKEDLKMVALKVAKSLDEQVATHGIDSMDDVETWNKLVILTSNIMLCKDLNI